MKKPCAWCREERHLKKSHIISKFALKLAAGDDESGMLVPVTLPNGPKTPRDQQWGVDHLLCGECEQKRGRHEAIVAGQLGRLGDGREKRPRITTSHDGRRPIATIKELNYKAVRLWNMSTIHLMDASRKAAWSGVELTEAEKDGLRSHLVRDCPGNDQLFPLVARFHGRSDEWLEPIGGVIQPGRIEELEHEGKRVRFCHFGALDNEWITLLNSKGDEGIASYRLRQNGTWTSPYAMNFQPIMRLLHRAGWK